MAERGERFNDGVVRSKRVYRDYYGDFRLTGGGKVTSAYCGTYHNVDGCIRVGLHAGKVFRHKDATGKVYIRKIHVSCKRNSCPLCFYYGFCMRLAGSSSNRLEGVAEKHGGLKIEHIVCSVPKSDYALGLRDFKALRLKAIEALKVRGIVGGSLIFHAYREDKGVSPAEWYASPHWHVLGYVEDGYSRCRKCGFVSTSICDKCDGFEAVTRREFKKDGYIIKVEEEREKSYYNPEKDNIYGTILYQLSHSTYNPNVRRFHILTYFGICGNRVFKSSPVVREKKVCPICSYDVEKLVYVGGLFHVEKWRREKGFGRGSNEFLLPFKEDGRVVWILDGVHR